jgi:hypothetical protein
VPAIGIRLGLAAMLSVAVSGCAFNLACDVFGSFFQRQMPSTDVCGTFNGECCGDENGDGFPDECSGIFGTSPCGRFDTDDCFCTAGIGFGVEGQTLLPAPAAYAFPPGAGFGLRLPFAGMSTSHQVFFDTVAQDLQTRQAVVTYPDAFGFDGFLALGPPETVIGALGVDLNLDAATDFSLPLKALTADTAYVDGDASGAYNAADPLLTHAVGSHVFTLTAPRGGDGLARTKVGRIPLRLGVALYAGILRNPTTPATYFVNGTFTSVDPDSGDVDDGVNLPPTSFAAPAADVTIFEPPYGQLSPFLCYATKPTKGTTCRKDALGNIGGVCATDADCLGTPGSCVKNPIPKGLTATIDDELTDGPSDLIVAKHATLCTPAEIDGAGVPADQDGHLRGYAVKAAKGAPKYVGAELVPVTNAFGTVVVSTTKRDRLLVRTTITMGGSPDGLVAQIAENFTCHKVKLVKKRCAEDPFRKCKTSADCGVDGPCTQSFPKGLTAAVADSFTTFATPRTLGIGKPTRLCYATELETFGPPDFGQAMLCYQVKPGPGVAKHAKIGAIFIANPLVRERADTVKESELCVPSVFGGGNM